jgi:hypothetical protein
MKKNEVTLKIKELKDIIDNIRVASSLKLYNDLKNNMSFMMMYMDTPPSSNKQMRDDFANLDREEKMHSYLLQANAYIKNYCEKINYYNMASRELGDLVKISEEKDETYKVVPK